MIERRYLGRTIVGETKWRIPSRQQLRDMAADHYRALRAGEIDMVEMEFPDAPIDERFLRLGFNPAGMIEPISIEEYRRRQGWSNSVS